jgi:hypothetical protein
MGGVRFNRRKACEIHTALAKSRSACRTELVQRSHFRFRKHGLANFGEARTVSPWRCACTFPYAYSICLVGVAIMSANHTVFLVDGQTDFYLMH